MAWKTLHCTGHCENLKSKVKLQLLFLGEALIPALQRFTCWPAASILMVDRGQVMPGGWKTDMGHGRTHPTDFFFFFSEKGPSPRALAARLTALEEGEHFQLSKTCCEFSPAHGRATLGTQKLLGRAARASRWLGHVWINTKRGNEVSQLLLHMSKRRRRRADREINISPTAPLSPANSHKTTKEQCFSACSEQTSVSLPVHGIPDFNRA